MKHNYLNAMGENGGSVFSDEHKLYLDSNGLLAIEEGQRMEER